MTDTSRNYTVSKTSSEPTTESASEPSLEAPYGVPDTSKNEDE